MKILMATTNNNKVIRIKKLLKDYDYEIYSLKDLGYDKIPEPEETKNTPIEIALEKALYYVNNIDEEILVLCQDDTLVMEGIKEEDSPGMHIKGPVYEKYGEFNDELACEYYTELAKKYGGSISLTFNYGHAFVKKSFKERNIIQSIAAGSKMKLKLVDKIVGLEKVPGYFLSAITEAYVNDSWIPYTKLTEEQEIEVDVDLKKSILQMLDTINK